MPTAQDMDIMGIHLLPACVTLAGSEDTKQQDQYEQHPGLGHCLGASLPRPPLSPVSDLLIPARWVEILHACLQYAATTGTIHLSLS